MADVLLVAFAWYFAYLLRFNFDIPVQEKGMFIRVLPLILLIKIVTFYFPVFLPNSTQGPFE